MIADTSGVLARQNVWRKQKTTCSAATGIQHLRYRAVWRSKQLIILPLNCHPFRQKISAVLEDDSDRLLACLRHSDVNRLLLSPDLPITEIRFWAELGEQAGLRTYVRQSNRAVRLSASVRQPLFQIGQATALILLILTSPILLGGALVFWLYCGCIFERQWRVSSRGQLYRMWSFPNRPEQLPSMLSVLCQLRFRRLPHLINVLLGQALFFSGVQSSIILYEEVEVVDSTQSLGSRRYLSEARSTNK